MNDAQLKFANTFIYHIVNIKLLPLSSILYPLFIFIYHIVNIKLNHIDDKQLSLLEFIYHIVNIKRILS